MDIILLPRYCRHSTCLKIDNQIARCIVANCTLFRTVLGPLAGRPFGGTAILVKKDLLPACECIDVSERIVVVRLGDLLCVNVYLPSRGTPDRELLYKDILDNICYSLSGVP